MEAYQSFLNQEEFLDSIASSSFYMASNLLAHLHFSPTYQGKAKTHRLTTVIVLCMLIVKLLSVHLVHVQITFRRKSVHALDLYGDRNGFLFSFHQQNLKH